MKDIEEIIMRVIKRERKKRDSYRNRVIERELQIEDRERDKKRKNR